MIQTEMIEERMASSGLYENIKRRTRKEARSREFRDLMSQKYKEFAREGVIE